MNDLALAEVERRLRRLERQNRVLIALLCGVLALGSIAATNAQQTVLSAYEVRAQRFTLLDPNGAVAADWFTLPSPRDGDMFHGGGPYSGWPFFRP
jgi:hypothetical protein